MGSEKFTFKGQTLREFGLDALADEADLTLEKWNALSADAKKAHLKKSNAALRAQAKAEWEDAQKWTASPKEDAPEKPAKKGKREPEGFKPKPKPALRMGGLTSGGLKLGRLMASQPGSNGSEGMKYLDRYSPFSSERGSNKPGSNPPAPKPKKPVPFRHVPEEGARKGLDEALAHAGMTRADLNRAYGDSKGF